MDFSRCTLEWSHVSAAWAVSISILALAVWAVRKGWIR